MRKKVLAYWWLVAVATAVWPWVRPATVHADSPVYISQVQITGGPGRTTEDFIELFNPNNEPVNLKDHRLVKRTAQNNKDQLIKTWTEDAYIPPHGFFLWTNESFASISLAPDATSSATLADNNGIGVRAGPSDTGLLLDSLSWGVTSNEFRTVVGENPAAGQVLMRTDHFAPNSGFGLGASTPRNTSSPVLPGEAGGTGICTIPPVQSPSAPPEPSSSSSETSPSSNSTQSQHKAKSNLVSIVEILPNPAGEDGGNEAIELFNADSETVDVTGWLIDDAGVEGKPGSNAHTLSGTIAAGSVLSVVIPKGRFTLNNSGDMVALFFADKEVAERVTYPDEVEEGLSLQKIEDSWYWQNPSLGAVNTLDASTEESPPEAAANTTAETEENTDDTNKPTAVSAAAANKDVPKTIAKSTTVSIPKTVTLKFEKATQKTLNELQTALRGFGGGEDVSSGPVSETEVSQPDQESPENTTMTTQEGKPSKKPGRTPWLFLGSALGLAGIAFLLFKFRSDQSLLPNSLN